MVSLSVWPARRTASYANKIRRQETRVPIDGYWKRQWLHRWIATGTIRKNEHGSIENCGICYLHFENLLLNLLALFSFLPFRGLSSMGFYLPFDKRLSLHTLLCCTWPAFSNPLDLESGACYNASTGWKTFPYNKKSFYLIYQFGSLFLNMNSFVLLSSKYYIHGPISLKITLPILRGSEHPDLIQDLIFQLDGVPMCELNNKLHCISFTSLLDVHLASADCAEKTRGDHQLMSSSFSWLKHNRAPNHTRGLGSAIDEGRSLEKVNFKSLHRPAVAVLCRGFYQVHCNASSVSFWKLSFSWFLIRVTLS